MAAIGAVSKVNRNSAWQGPPSRLQLHTAKLTLQVHIITSSITSNLAFKGLPTPTPSANFPRAVHRDQLVAGAMSIRPLPRHVAEQIKSSVLITSLNDAVSGLVKNALDAEASTINIYLDYVKGGCTVEDNGVGIPPSEFRQDGGLAKAHRRWSTRGFIKTGLLTEA